MKFLREHALAVLFALHVVLTAALFPRVVGSPLLSDEAFYDNAAKALANGLRQALSGGGIPTHELQDRLLSNGWFMPGTSVLLAPLYLVAPDAGLTTMRLYMAVLSLIVFGIVVFIAQRTLGRAYAVALLIFPGLVPIWVLYTFATFGDELAGLAIIFVIVLMVGMWHHVSATRTPPPLARSLLLGVALAATLYLRSSTLPLVVGMLGLSLIACAVLLRRRSLVLGVARVGVAAVIFAALLAPWSIAVTHTFGAPVFTTTDLSLAEAYTFGHRDQLCFGPCPGRGGIWLEMARYSRIVGAATGQSEIVVQHQMAAYALRDVTLHGYASDVLEDANRYALQPGGHTAVILFRTGPIGGLRGGLIVWTTNLLYFLALGAACLGMVAVRRVRDHHHVIAILSGLAAAALFIQPFVHVSTSRYWPTFAPLLALLAATLFAPRVESSGRSTLRVVHGAVAAAWLVVIALVVAVAML